MSAVESPCLATDRVLLRRWREDDHDAFAALNADPEVMEHFPATLDDTQSRVFAEMIDAAMATRPYGLWAAEVPGVAPFIGFVGLTDALFEASFTPCVEIGWRLARPWWGHGYVTEAAQEVLRYGFEGVGLDEIQSFTTTRNQRSRAVMERLGMRRDPADDFDHPNVADGHPQKRHVRYRLDAARWRRGREATPVS